jgi:integrase
MKVKKITKRGEEVWLVDGKINGKRKRMFFDTKPQAEAWLKAEAKDTTCQQWWLDLNNAERVDMMNAFMRSRDEGFTLLSAVDHFAVSGRGHVFLKKMTLGKAIGSLGPNLKFKDQSKQPEPSGFLGAKVLAQMSKSGRYTLACTIANFRDYIGAERQCATITPEEVQQWVTVGGPKRKKWKSVTKQNYLTNLSNFFNWLIRKKVVAENPVQSLERINVDHAEPEILSVDECKTVLSLARAKHPEVLPLLVLNLFCGIRPSEVRRLGMANFDFDLNEVELKGGQTKTRRRRFVSMSDNCTAWLSLAKWRLPITDSVHKWEVFLRDAKVELGIEGRWPHDCLRHSYCSYGLAHTQNAAKIALEAGHTEQILFTHYRKLVKKPEAEKFWAIFPEDTQDQFHVVAA